MADSEQDVAEAGSDATTSRGAGGSEVGASGIAEGLPAGKQQKCVHESNKTAKIELLTFFLRVHICTVKRITHLTSLA